MSNEVSPVLDEQLSADDLAFLATMTTGPSAVESLARVRPGTLSEVGRVDALIAWEKLAGWVQAQQHRLLAEMAEHPGSIGGKPDKGWVREDVQAALGISGEHASDRLALAGELVHRLPETLAFLQAGELSGYQARSLVEAVRPLTDAVAWQVQERMLAKAELPSGSFRRALRRAVLQADPTSAEDRRRRSIAERHVRIRAVEPGVSVLFALLPAEGAAAVLAALHLMADRHGQDDPRTGDQRRADALVQLALDRLAGVCAHCGEQPAGLRPAIQVTVARSTLLGLDDQPGELDGHGPIPAAVARALAQDQSGTWRRICTDPVGVLLDYGRTTYRPPTALREHVIARDRTCRFPGCNRSAQHAEIDHLSRWADGGQTNSANLHALSGRHHHAKDEHHWRPRRLTDGTTRWTAPTGHTYDVPPEAYPIDATMQKIERDPPPQADPGPPPF